MGKASQKICQGGTETAGPDCLPPSEVRGAKKDCGIAQMGVAKGNRNLNDHGHNADEGGQQRAAAKRKSIMFAFHFVTSFYYLYISHYNIKLACHIEPICVNCRGQIVDSMEEKR